MIIIRSMNTNTLPRLVARSLQDRLRVMPAEVVTGARQTGKSTLVQELVPGGRKHASMARTRRARRAVVDGAVGGTATPGDRLYIMPAVVVMGARRTGKGMLAREPTPGKGLHPRPGRYVGVEYRGATASRSQRKGGGWTRRFEKNARDPGYGVPRRSIHAPRVRASV
jgi:hypothetical protein